MQVLIENKNPPATAIATEPCPPHVADVLFGLLVVAVFGYLLAYFLFADIRSLVSFLPDDALYFFKTAENLAAGKGMTFDGINRTNGFQPLWLLMLVPLYTAVHASPESMTRIILICQAIFNVGLSIFFYRLLSRFVTKSAALLGAAVFAFWAGVSSTRGMESPLLIAALVLLLYWGWKYRIFSQHRRWPEFVFGIILGLLMLSRLDHVFIAMAIAGYGVYWWLGQSRRRGQAFMSLVMVGLGAVIVVLPYLVYNKLSFGNFMPISGQIKSTFPEVSITGAALLHLSKAKLATSFLMIFYVAYFFATPKSLRELPLARRYLRVATLIFAIGLLLHFTDTLLFMYWGVSGWHFIAYNVFFSLFVAEAYEIVSAKFKVVQLRFAYWALALALLAAGTRQVLHDTRLRWDHSPNVASYEAALWIRTHTSPGDVLAMLDTGTAAYYSERSIINLDGLVNSLDYQVVLRDKQLVPYLQSKGVKYLCYWNFLEYDRLSGDYGAFRVKYRSFKYKTDSDDLLMRREDEVFRTSTYYHYRTGKPFFLMIWRIDYSNQTDDRPDEAVRAS